jgi:negative regulator of sigma E activity
MTIDVSDLLDGQLEPEDAKRALEETASRPELRDRYTIYGLVGDVLRGNSTPDDGFSIRILQRMQMERVRMESGYDPLADDLP